MTHVNSCWSIANSSLLVESWIFSKYLLLWLVEPEGAEHKMGGLAVMSKNVRVFKNFNET